MKKRYLKLLSILFFVLGTASLLPLKAQFYYGLNQEFGKNRVQYLDFDWFLHRFERYDIYFYRGNDELAKQVARLTDKTLVRIENFLDAPLEDRVQILVFNNLSDLKQSNVNSNNDEDYNSTGVTRISGRRLFLHFNGSYADLEKKLRSGLAEVVLSNLVYGGFTQSLKNSTLLNLPEWYTEGLISYIGEDWSMEIDAKVKDGFLSGQYKRINSLIGEDAKYAGHSFWHYIGQTYGRKVLKNIIYMAIVNRNIESGFSYILGKDLEMITKGWKEFYKEQYKDGIFEDELKEPLIKVPKNKRITRMELNHDASKLAYVKQKFGEYRVYIKDLKTGKKKRILRGGYKIAQNADYTFPLLAWHPNGEILAMFTEEKGFVYLNFYNLAEKKLEKKQFFKFDEILSFDYSKDGKRFIMSAVKKNQSDIFIYTILNTKIEQLTNDSYDDFDPAFFDDEKRVVFSSNRITDTLKKKEWSKDFPKKSVDLFAMTAKEPKSDTSVIWRLTNSDGINERASQEYQDGYLTFLSGRSGIVNRHLIKIDSAISYVDTITHYEYSFKEFQQSNYNRSILDQSIGQEGGKNYTLVLKDRRYKIFETNHFNAADFSGSAIADIPEQKGAIRKDSANASSESTQTELISSNDVSPLYYPGINPDDYEIDIGNYQFEDESKVRRRRARKEEAKKVKILPSPEKVTSIPEEEELEIPPKRNYFLSFYKDDFSIGFDNIFSNPQYQRFTGFVTPDLLNFGFNSNFKVGVIDLMHDYRIIGAANTNFQPLSGTSIAPNAEFYVSVSNYKKRLDIDYVFSRRSQVLIQNFANYNRIITYEVMPKFSWPFNPVASIRGSVGYRMDKTVALSRESSSLEEQDLYKDYAVAKASFVFDNTRKIGLNLYAGLRYKVFAEYYRNLNLSPTGLYTAGIDARHYTIIHRNLIWANRFASGFSWGSERLIYIMGGVDNSFSNSVEPTPIADNNNYVFQTLVTNMRGSFQNIRNGDKFAVINSELRWPFLSYLYKRPIRSDIFKNLQIVGFADIGTAWNGPSPYSEENKINTTEIPFGSSGLIVLDSQKEPIIAGVGTGLRTRVFGYFVRFDWAWGIEDGLMKPRVFSFSLGTDF